MDDTKHRKIRLEMSLVTDNIYAVRETDSLDNKQDVTSDFLQLAVARWNGYEEVIESGDRKYKIRCEEARHE